MANGNGSPLTSILLDANVKVVWAENMSFIKLQARKELRGKENKDHIPLLLSV
jgi:hypothetical protein